jgi:hypothetical protein
VKVVSHRSLTGIRRWGPYFPLVILIAANGLELWTRVSMPTDAMTGGDYFTMAAQAGICVICSILLLVCLYVGFVPATGESKACLVDRAVQNSDSKEDAPTACPASTEKKRLRRNGRSSLSRKHAAATKCLPRKRFRGIE